MTNVVTAGSLGKQRGGIAVVLLSLITLGIYWLVYVFKTHSELRRHTGGGLSGGWALVIAIFLGFLSPFLLGIAADSARERSGMPHRVSALTGFWTWLPLIGIFIFCVKIQNALNEYWVNEGAAPR
jgi:hypothetical protein